jgi:hypothetical protein
MRPCAPFISTGQCVTTVTWYAYRLPKHASNILEQEFMHLYYCRHVS